MSVQRPKLRYGFAWQAALIVLPLLALAAFALISLQQDRKIAYTAAVERAQSLADSLVLSLWGELASVRNNEALAFTVDSRGNLVSPEPALQPDVLAAEAPVISGAGIRLYQQALKMAQAGQMREAARAFVEVATRFPNHRGETGLPLGSIAAFKFLQLYQESSVELDNGGITLDSFCSNLVTHPHPLSPMLLERAKLFAASPETRSAIQKWETVWKNDETAREAFLIANSRMGNLTQAPEISRLDRDSILVADPPHLTNRSFALINSRALSSAFQARLSQARGIPDYFLIKVDLAGSMMASNKVHSSADALSTPRLMAASARKERDTELLKVSVLLSDPPALYAQQRTRTYWFGSFIAVSSAVALLGLFGAWRSFRQQERLNEMKSNFVSSVSHELRAPIASVRLMAENLERCTITEEPRRMEYFRFISQECRRLSSLIENVLDFSRIEQGRKQYEFVPVDLRRIIDSTVQLMQPHASERGVALSVVMSDAAVPQISADGKALQQALINLVDNAIKHSPKGSVIKIGLEPASSQNGVLLWVEDQGEGIPAAEHERIFERFYRLGSELRRETQGVGIGLSIVKHIVEAHHGKIHVRSAPGQGSRFTIDLPQNAAAHSATPKNDEIP